MVKLGMDERWMPDPQFQPKPCFPNCSLLDRQRWLNSYGFLMWFRWSLIATGWIQATVFLAALSSRFKE
jgi:hypothetical protein